LAQGTKGAGWITMITWTDTVGNITLVESSTIDRTVALEATNTVQYLL